MEGGSQGGWIGEGGSEAREHALHTGRWIRGADYAVGKGQGDQGLLAAEVEGPGWLAADDNAQGKGAQPALSFS